jgi:hypothetical protein
MAIVMNVKIITRKIKMSIASSCPERFRKFFFSKISFVDFICFFASGLLGEKT